MLSRLNRTEPSEESSSGPVFEAKRTHLHSTAHIRAALDAPHAPSILLSVVAEQFPGVPKGATTIPPMFSTPPKLLQQQAAASGADADGSPASSALLDPLHERLAADKGVPRGFALTHRTITEDVPDGMTLDAKALAAKSNVSRFHLPCFADRMCSDSPRLSRQTSARRDH